MDQKLQLDGACVHTDGRFLNQSGQLIGWYVPEGGRTILDERGRIIGTITRAGRVYDRLGLFVAEVLRRDINDR